MKKIYFFLRNLAKMAVQNCILPCAYTIAKMRHPEKKTLYVFADAHNTQLPFSLAAMHKQVLNLGITPVCHFHDYTHEGNFRSLKNAISFMDILAQAKYVFICDTFLPVSSVRLTSDTKVAYLSHFSGPFKKIGYATADDIPKFYRGNVYRNYHLVSVSAPMYVPLLTSALRQKEGTVQALGISRSDVFYDKIWIQQCQDTFYAQYPQARNKKILLWCPTFRGKALAPRSLGNKVLLKLGQQLGEEWMVLIKHHPHDDAVATNPENRSNCTLPSEVLLPVVDLLITDYSTTVLDYLIFEKPFVLFAPDFQEYQKTRGFFVDYPAITKHFTTDPAQLESIVLQTYKDWENGDREDILRCKSKFISACDGHATQRILQSLTGAISITGKEESI